jgi:hypothetical protein
MSDNDRVYFALVGDFVKVGYSSAPNVRMREIRADANCLKPEGFDPSQPVELLRTVPGSHRAEDRAHQALQEWHANGEWFHATPQCLAAIAFLTQDGLISEARALLMGATA